MWQIRTTEPIGRSLGFAAVAVGVYILSQRRSNLRVDCTKLCWWLGLSSSLVLRLACGLKPRRFSNSPTRVGSVKNLPATHQRVSVEEPTRSARSTGLIEIDLSDGKRVRVDTDVDADALGRVLDVVERR